MHPGLLVLGGFLLGTAGVKAATSRPVRKACVRTTVRALQCKDYVSHVVDEAKAQCDDILAEAEVIKAEEEAEREEEIAVDEVVAVDGDTLVVEDSVTEEPAQA